MQSLCLFEKLVFSAIKSAGNSSLKCVLSEIHMKTKLIYFKKLAINETIHSITFEDALIQNLMQISQDRKIHKDETALINVSDQGKFLLFRTEIVNLPPVSSINKIQIAVCPTVLSKLLESQ